MLAAIVLVVFIVTLGNPLCEVAASPSAQAEQAQQQPGSPIVCADEDFHFFGDSWAQWLMMVFAILATGVSAYAVKLVRDTFRETKRTADAAEHANRQSARVALAAQEANAVARQMGEAQVRAYVSVSNIRGVVDPASRLIKIEAYIKNTGPTPARQVNYSAGLVFVDQDGRRVHGAEGTDLSDPIDLLTGEPRSIFNDDAELDGGQFADLRRRNGSVLFEGAISYETVFDRRPRWTPWTRFCFEVRWDNPKTTTELTFVRAKEGNHST